MYQFSEEELSNVFTEIYKEGYYGYLDLCDAVVEKLLEKYKDKKLYYGSGIMDNITITPMDTVPATITGSTAPIMITTSTGNTFSLSED